MKKVTNMRTDIKRSWLREKRLNKGLRMIDAAEKFGVSKNYIGDIEHGRRNPSAKLAYMMANEFDFDVEMIIADSIESR